MKHNYSNIKFFILSVGFLFLFYSCDGFLELKPDKKMHIPSTLDDIQNMLDNSSALNNGYPGAIGIMSDDYYLDDAGWSSLNNATERNLYLWENDENTINYWLNTYSHIFHLNVALDELSKIKIHNSLEWKYNMLYGSALFYRSLYFYSLLNLYSKPYNENSASDDLGIPLRLDPDHSLPSYRASIKDSYDQVINDLKKALFSLPDEQVIKTRPSRSSTFGLLSKVYLSMGKYKEAGLYADSCLQLSNKLMDFNNLSPGLNTPISRFNEEVIFHHRTNTITPLSGVRAKVDTLLINSYSNTDLRKKIFFQESNNGDYKFKGDYDGIGLGSTGFVFTGITTNEMYLILAECLIRQGQLKTAENILNELLINRHLKTEFAPLIFNNQGKALKEILLERRKELVFRDTRWLDIRRLSFDDNNRILPKRNIMGKEYVISSNKPYLLKIPQKVIELTNIEQN